MSSPLYIQHVKIKNIDLVPWLFSFILYGVLLLAHGYVYGYEDQIDFMPYAVHVQQKLWYIGDFYIECMKGHLNERWFLVHALAILPEITWPWAFFMIHLCTSVLLIRGLLQFGRYMKLAVWIQWAVIASSLIVLYHRNLGGNELYYNLVTPSLLAKAIGIWSLWYALNQSKWRAMACAVVAIYIHPVAGVQLFFLGLILIHGSGRIFFTITTLLFTLPYLLPLYFQLDQVTNAPTLAEVMQLRNPHHFMPSHFGVFNTLFLTPLFVLSTVLAYRINKDLFYTMSFILAGCLLYIILLNFNPSLSYKTQWFKATIWLKFFSILILAKAVQNGRYNFYDHLTFRFRQLFASAFFICTFLISIRQSRFASYNFPWSAPSADQQIAIQAGALSQPDDVFLVPADFTAFKYFAKRPTWVDWKAIPHQSSCLATWAAKIKLAYGLSTGYQGSLNEIYNQSNQFLRRLSPQAKEDLKFKGVDFIVFKPENELTYRIEKL